MIELTQSQAPNLFEYDNYRKFLKDVYDFRKSEKKTFSFRFLSRACGFASPNFLKLVMQGKRNLTAESMEKISRALKLNKEETLFFRNLVFLNQAKSVEEKQHHARELMRSRVYKRLHPLAKTQYEYWSRWYNIPIRELVGMPGFQEDPEWIAKHLAPRISPQEVEISLRQLLDLGLIKRNDKGRLIQNEVDVFSGDEVTSVSVSQFHREMIEKARESLDRFTGKERQVTALTFSLSREKSEEIKLKIHDFRKELMAMAAQDKNPITVFQLNFQFFPLTDPFEENH